MKNRPPLRSPSEAPALRHKARAAALSAPDPSHHPRILIGGSGPIARAIVDAAHEHEVPVVEESPLAEKLAPLSDGMAVPHESLNLIAEILGFLYESDEEWRRNHPAYGELPLEERVDKR